MYVYIYFKHKFRKMLTIKESWWLREQTKQLYYTSEAQGTLRKVGRREYKNQNIRRKVVKCHLQNTA